MTKQAVATRGPSTALAVVREDLERMKPQFALMLPAHISADRFVRILFTAISRNGKLVECERKSFLNAATFAAQDGLEPDGRFGAIVPFKKGRDAPDDGTPGGPGDLIATWIPMVRGLRDLVRRSGAIRELNCQIVYVDEEEQGAFVQELGSNHFVKHKRLAWHGDPTKRPVFGAYSQAWDKQGFELVHEFMDEGELMAVARKSRSFKFGPWSDPLFALEMRRKTVTRRHYKQLPSAGERLERLFERENDIEERREQPPRRREEITTFRGGAGAALEHFANGATPQAEPPPPASSSAAEPPPASSSAAEPPPSDEPPPIEHFEDRGDAGEVDAPADSADAKTEAEYVARFRAYLLEARTSQAIEAKWKRERDARNKLNITPETRDALDGERRHRMAQIDAGK